MEESLESDCTKSPSPDELWNMTFPKEQSISDRIFAIPFEDKAGSWEPRYYQNNAITKTL